MNKNFFTKPLNILLLAIVSTALWGSAIPVIKIGYEAYQIEGNDVASKLLFAGIRFFFGRTYSCDLRLHSKEENCST